MLSATPPAASDRALTPTDPSTHTDGIREQIGAALGGAWAPLVGAIARLRSARVFHADGQLFRATLAPRSGTAYDGLAQRLGRTVLARLSPALWRHGREWPDVLGVAFRFHRGAKLSTHVTQTDQDLLFATIRSPLTLGLSPFATRQHDYLANRYWAVSPFAFGGDHRIELRLTPRPHEARSGARADRLSAAVHAGEAAFTLEARRTLTLRWQGIADVRLDEPLALDQDALRFDPFQAGAGLLPVGAVHAIRRAVYAASQAARPGTDRELAMAARY